MKDDDNQKPKTKKETTKKPNKKPFDASFH